MPDAPLAGYLDNSWPETLSPAHSPAGHTHTHTQWENEGESFLSSVWMTDCVIDYLAVGEGRARPASDVPVWCRPLGAHLLRRTMMMIVMLITVLLFRTDTVCFVLLLGSDLWIHTGETIKHCSPSVIKTESHENMKPNKSMKKRFCCLCWTPTDLFMIDLQMQFNPTSQLSLILKDRYGKTMCSTHYLPAKLNLRGRNIIQITQKSHLNFSLYRRKGPKLNQWISSLII